MDFNTKYIPYQQTGFFSKIVTDYLINDATIEQFYTHPPNIEGIKKAIAYKKGTINRNVLVNYFNSQYFNHQLSELQQQNINFLKQENCFTITTAHQPNIFTGPLYFIFKILHAIKLADTLSNDFPENKFVPVYYMGSEDADLDELGNINIQGKKLAWETAQTGAVGRMRIDKNFIQLIKEIEGQIAVNPFGKELIDFFTNSYQLGKTIDVATFELVNFLFAKYGLLVLVPDNADLKKAFIPTIKKEIEEQFSREVVDKTNIELSKHYKTQAAGREINLFYLIDDKRERIEKKDNLFIVEKLGLQFNLDEILQELNNHPERFSPNVILRPVFQETILPNVAFIGGGGELAYWLQLKNVFEEVNIPYPVLVLRNSFLLYNSNQENKLQKMDYNISNLFAPTEKLFTNLVAKQSRNNLSLANQLTETQAFYNALKNQTAQIDASLTAHVEAIAVKALKKIEALEKKLWRAEKRKFTDQKNQLQNIKAALFPNDNLQERVENFSYHYSIYGNSFLDTILSSSKGLEQQFALISINK
ncbi:MAG: bacillithiol biosynthesis cysteine-adding enzyme BshC [Chitinophagaceae bacterium]